MSEEIINMDRMCYLSGLLPEDSRISIVEGKKINEESDYVQYEPDNYEDEDLPYEEQPHGYKDQDPDTDDDIMRALLDMERRIFEETFRRRVKNEIGQMLGEMCGDCEGCSGADMGPGGALNRGTHDGPCLMPQSLEDEEEEPVVVMSMPCPGFDKPTRYGHGPQTGRYPGGHKVGFTGPKGFLGVGFKV